MSDIPRARAILEKGLQCKELKLCHYAMRAALDLMGREQPTFKTERKLPKLTEEQKQFCRQLRSEGLPIQEIARKLDTNIGRVSEAINDKRPGPRL